VVGEITAEEQDTHDGQTHERHRPVQGTRK